MRAMLPEGFRLPFEIEDRIDPGLIAAHAGYRWYSSCFAASGRPRSPMSRSTSNSGRSWDRLRPVMRIEPHVLTILCCTEQDLTPLYFLRPGTLIGDLPIKTLIDSLTLLLEATLEQMVIEDDQTLAVGVEDRVVAITAVVDMDVLATFAAQETVTTSATEQDVMANSSKEQIALA